MKHLSEVSIVSIELMKEMLILHKALKRYICDSPVKKEATDIAGTHSWVIGYLYDHEGEDIYQKDLEREFGLSRSATSKMIDVMEKKGLVKRVKVLCDDRLKKIVLTEKSKQLGEKIRLDNIELNRKLASGFSTEELQCLVTFINRMKNNINGEEKI